MRYKNVIFDFGNVLIRFDTDKIVESLVDNSKDAELLNTVIFERSIWDRLDSGTISNSECKEMFNKSLPERLHETASKIYDSWINFLPEVEGMRELIIRLKENGCRVFVLSNISKYFSENRDKAPILELFDGVVLSADIGLVKPDTAIYKYICEKFSIDKNDAIFIDDNEKNIAAAKDFGLDTWLYSFDTDELTDRLIGKE